MNLKGQKPTGFNFCNNDAMWLLVFSLVMMGLAFFGG